MNCEDIRCGRMTVYHTKIIILNQKMTEQSADLYYPVKNYTLIVQWY